MEPVSFCGLRTRGFRMLYLLVVSFIWAFSFGLIGNTLAGVDPYLLAASRLGIAFLFFLPLLRWRHARARALLLPLAITGALQYGMMYLLLFRAYSYLQSHEVALLTIFTPIYVTLLNDLLTGRLNRLFLATALLAVAGAGIIRYTAMGQEEWWRGVLLMQGSNLCFAAGQVYYRHLLRRHPGVRDRDVFAVLYAGAFALAAVAARLHTDWDAVHLAASQMWAIAYLGVIASGLAFFLWNVGARRVDAGALAIFNNLKIPLAMAVSLLVFGETTNMPRLLTGGGIIVAALGLNEWLLRTKSPKTLSEEPIKA